MIKVISDLLGYSRFIQKKTDHHDKNNILLKVLRVASIILTFSAKHTKLRTLIRKMYRQDTNENITGLVQQSPKCRVGNPISVQKSM